MAKLYYRGWLVGQLVSWSVGRGRSVGQSVSQSEDRCFIDLRVWYFSNAFKQRQQFGRSEQHSRITDMAHKGWQITQSILFECDIYPLLIDGHLKTGLSLRMEYSMISAICSGRSFISQLHVVANLSIFRMMHQFKIQHTSLILSMYSLTPRPFLYRWGEKGRGRKVLVNNLTPTWIYGISLIFINQQLRSHKLLQTFFVPHSNMQPQSTLHLHTISFRTT